MCVCDIIYIYMYIVHTSVSLLLSSFALVLTLNVAKLFVAEMNNVFCFMHTYKQLRHRSLRYPL